MLDGVLIVAAVLCGLVAGLLFAFAVVVMPGIGGLGDAEFIRAFQVIDGVIQRNQPLFILVFVGSVLAVAAAAILSLGTDAGATRWLITAAAVLYLVGVQAPTFVVNVPLNNALQRVSPNAEASEMRQARAAFERRWNRWNAVRTTCAAGVTLLLVLAARGSGG